MNMFFNKFIKSTKEDKGGEAKKKICCVCLETKKLRDECIINLGEDQCKKFIDDHNQCLRKEGFDSGNINICGGIGISLIFLPLGQDKEEMLRLNYKIGKNVLTCSGMVNNCKMFRQYVTHTNEMIIGRVNSPFKNNLTTIDKSSTFHNSGSSNMCVHTKLNNNFKRFYNPRAHINWTLIRFRHRVSQLRKKKLKYKNHSKVALRFRLTKFGWERLQSGRNASKKNLSAKKCNEKMKIKYVSRDDIKKFKFQMQSYVLRIRDSPVDYNPNIMRARKYFPTHFG
ncbi:hypothetical protein MKS88_003315 [Plasmodium brasilianum]|nr:hypothetical protein MKS88_003315 [Plasmodium brasilianum]